MAAADGRPDADGTMVVADEVGAAVAAALAGSPVAAEASVVAEAAAAGRKFAVREMTPFPVFLGLSFPSA